MKQINTYINEKLRLSAKPQYTCQPKDFLELRKIIIERIKDEGNDCDLNDIDVSKITDMSFLFDVDDYEIFEDFNGDISMWDVSNVKNMQYMFHYCEKFSCDLSKWNVSNVTKMNSMFSGCEKFNCDISRWDVSKVETMRFMFNGCEKFNCNISTWDVSNVKDIAFICCSCEKLNCDLSTWDVSNVTDMEAAFKNCPTTPTWYDKTKCERYS